MATWPKNTPLPDGATHLTTDEAVEMVVTGNHPQSVDGNVITDAVVIELLRRDLAVAIRLADGTLGLSASQELIDQRGH